MRLLAGAALAAACTACRTGPATISVDARVTHQAMAGWEATAQGGHESPLWPRYGDRLVAAAVDSLGIDRLRLEVRSGSEHRRDYRAEVRAGRLTGDDARCARYETVNDNDDPRVIDPAGFHFTELDATVERLVLPMKRLLESRGRRLVVNLEYVAFFRQCPAGRRYDHQSPDEYAEFALAAMLHLRERWGLVPDYYEVVLEPDNTDFWRGRQIGEAIVATARRFREHGFPTRFIAPSNTSMAAAIQDYDALAAVPGARAEVAEIAYHRYRAVSNDALRELAARARRDSVHTAMLEHIGSGIDHLLDDVTTGDAGAWQQYALAWPGGPDNGSLYFDVRVDSGAATVRLSRSARLLSEVFRHVRLGAVRLDASSSAAAVRTAAFRNPDGRQVVIVRAKSAAEVRIEGLAAGNYGSSWSTDSTTAAGRDTTIAEGGVVAATLPSGGVLAVFGR